MILLQRTFTSLVNAHVGRTHGAQPERGYNAVLFFQLSVPRPVSSTLGVYAYYPKLLRLQMISLPYGRAFNEQALVSYIQTTGRNYIIQGQQSCSFANHSKPQSLDYWLRQNYTNNPDTKQAENSVLNDLVNTGLFTIERRLLCPDKETYCKGVRLV
ncbi:MAG: hypothetical protein ACXW1U_17155 [Methylobacter sp.]